MMNNNDFILSSIADILEDAVSGASGIGSGIETYPLSDYLLQSIFLKMTGFQEQKMKCICWEMATNDYEYRYEFTKVSLGECSTLKEKQAVYKELVKQIIKRDEKFDVVSGIDKKQILSQTTQIIKNLFDNSNLAVWSEKNYNEYKAIWANVKVNYFAGDKNNILASLGNGVSLITMYEEHLYKQRNRIAHNTVSYQQNLPTLKALVNANYIYENYFLHFSILVLIDRIFIELYKRYLESIN
jgi:hypothetical protein